MRPAQPVTRGTVMIVDDVPANLALLSDALDEAGFRVLVATDGASALEELNYVTPDVILMDGMMPGMDGFETCRRIKLTETTRNIPVIFMTALSELNDLLKGFDEGAVDYIVKPFRNEEVIARIRAQIQQSRASRRAEQALSSSGLAAMTIDAEGSPTWATPVADLWMKELSEKEASNPGDRPKVPGQLLDWARQNAKPGAAAASFVAQGTRGRYTVRLGPTDGEFLLLLQKRGDDWDQEKLRGALGLTQKEAEVLSWIARGKTNRDIGEILGSSPRTVNKHLEHIFEKLGVETRSAAVARAMDCMNNPLRHPGAGSVG
jgi:DNA-binding NarL/FixJ family response regulator